MGFIDEKTILLLYVYSNYEVNKKSYINISEINRVIWQVLMYRPYLSVNCDTHLMKSWAIYYGFEVDDCMINYEQNLASIYEYVDKILKKDSNLVKIFENAVNENIKTIKRVL